MADDPTSNPPGHASPAQRPARLALYLGAALLLAGGVVLYLGYDGAAKNPIPQAQTPYVISGGLVGLGLLALGGIALVIHVILSIQADFRGELRDMREAMVSLSEAMSHRVFDPAAAAAPSSNGHSTVFVARGASSFHRSDCRLVNRAEHTRALPRDEADRSGLLPCRVCKP